MDTFICVTDKYTGYQVWIRRSAIVRFSVFNGDTTIVVAGTNDQDNHICAQGDLTKEILRSE